MTLEKLPLPDIKSTIGQALDAIKPITTVDDFKHIKEEASEFLHSQDAVSIQKHLERCHDENDSYLDSKAISPSTGTVYGSLRGRTLPRNPFFILENDPLKSFTPSQAFRASLLTVSALRFIISMRQGNLSADFTPSGRPLTMSSYTNLFGTTMAPSGSGDDIGIGINRSPDSRHIVILCRGQFYALEVLSKESNQIWFSKYELTKRFKEIIADASKIDPAKAAESSIATFSTEKKPQWKSIRVKLEQTNAEQMKLIDSALFVVCLDHESPTSEMEKVQFASHGTTRTNKDGIQVGTCVNRLYDKLCFIVTPNSVAACLYPAAIMDGTSILRFLSDIYTDSILRLARHINGAHYTLWGNTNTVPINEKISKPKACRIHFELTKDLQADLHLAETRLTDIINQHEYVFGSVDGYGKKLITKKMKLPADSLIQVAIQLAYFAMYGRLTSTLEPISTRRFRNARTDPIATQSMIMTQLCQAFLSEKSDEEKWNLLLQAVDEHRLKVRNALKGEGFDRHLSALRAAYTNRGALNKMHPDLPAIPNDSPSFIFNPTVDRLYGPELLAANCGNSALHMFGITPSITNGFGIGYIIKDDAVSIVSSSQWRQTGRLCDTFVGVLMQIRNIWERIVKSPRVDNGDSRMDQLRVYLQSIPMKMVKSNHSTLQTASVEKPEHANLDTQILGGYDYFDVGAMNERSEMQSELQSEAQSRTITRTNSEVNIHRNIGRRLAAVSND